MPTARINKLIYPDQGIFLRVKTIAKNTQLSKSKDQYSLKFDSSSAVNSITHLTFIFINNLATVDSLSTLEKKFIDHYSWGSLSKIKSNSNTSEYYYYATPQKKNYTIKIGPLTENLEVNDIEVDWPNIQWGVQ